MSNEIIEILEELSESSSGQKMREEFEHILELKAQEHKIENISGLKQPRHKQYSYFFKLEDGLYAAEVFVKDGRNSYPDSHIEID